MPIEANDDVCLNKAAIIERSVRRVRQEFASDPTLKDFTHVDAMILNVERACQAAIDLSMHLVSIHHLGMPQTSADAFRILHQESILSEATMRAMMAMAGFRNIAVHQYQALDPAVLRAIGETRWRDLVTFCDELGLIIKP